MGANNECSANMDGKRAALDLATATRPEDFTNKCWNIDQKLTTNSSEYARSFMAAMNTELQEKHLLPKVELNMATAGDTPAMVALQNKKHVETQDLIKDENQLVGSGRITEAMLMHNLATNAPEIHDTHAERNFFGKNHGGIDMDRMNRWANQEKPDLRGALADIHSKPTANDRRDCPPDADSEKVALPKSAFSMFPERKSLWPDLAPSGEKNDFKFKDDPRATDYDKKQDADIRRLNTEVAQEKKAREEAERANQLKEKVEAGVIKDAHHTVKHGETLYDMACLALHKAGRDHMTPGAIKFEEQKIRMLNHLALHESLHSGQSLMLRTPQEVEHETARRIKLSEQNSSQNNRSRQYSPVPRVELLASQSGYMQGSDQDS